VRLSNSQRQFLLQAATEYAQHIHLAADYLATRGLSVDEARMFHLGVVANPLPGHEGYVGKLVIPYTTPSGVVDLRFRSIHGEDPKYIGLPGAKTTMFNAQAVLTADGYICVTEGEIDCITTVVKDRTPCSRNARC
jgi:DNA primase